jgi:hypothetical protein
VGFFRLRWGSAGWPSIPYGRAGCPQRPQSSSNIRNVPLERALTRGHRCSCASFRRLRNLIPRGPFHLRSLAKTLLQTTTTAGTQSRIEFEGSHWVTVELLRPSYTQLLGLRQDVNHLVAVRRDFARLEGASKTIVLLHDRRPFLRHDFSNLQRCHYQP